MLMGIVKPSAGQIELWGKSDAPTDDPAEAADWVCVAVPNFLWLDERQAVGQVCRWLLSDLG